MQHDRASKVADRTGAHANAAAVSKSAQYAALKRRFLCAVSDGAEAQARLKEVGTLTLWLDRENHSAHSHTPLRAQLKSAYAPARQHAQVR